MDWQTLLFDELHHVLLTEDKRINLIINMTGMLGPNNNNWIDLLLIEEFHTSAGCVN